MSREGEGEREGEREGGEGGERGGREREGKRERTRGREVCHRLQILDSPCKDHNLHPTNTQPHLPLNNVNTCTCTIAK